MMHAAPDGVLVLGRMFSGLADCLAAGMWRPRGVPTFCRLVENLHRDPEIALRTILFCKEPDSRFPTRRTIRTDEAGVIEIVPWRAPTAGRFRKIDRIATEFDHLLRVAAAICHRDVRLVYGTYGMVLALGVVARFVRKPVVLRLMGLFPQHRAMATGRYPALRWALRAPYAMIVCTEDGSDPSATLAPLVRPGTPLDVRLNGCDVIPAPLGARPSSEALTIVFLGRLERYKGADVFVDAALAAARELPGQFRFEVIGDGPLHIELSAKVAGARQEAALVFRGALPHDEVMSALQGADVYVSVNLYGNLSNANLEALAAGCAMVIPTSDPETPIDLSTDRLLPAGAVRRYDRADLPGALARTLVDLARNRGEVDRLRTATRDLAARLLKPWSERIESDKRRLKMLLRGEAIA